MTKTLSRLFLLLITAVLVHGCIEDSIDTSPSSQPVFSAETVDMGLVFTGERTPVMKLMVYNRHDKVMNISDISLRGGSNDFRINVDGIAGHDFKNIEIRPKDSIYVFVDAMLPEIGSPVPAEVSEYIDFVTNGVTKSVKLCAKGQDVVRLNGLVIDTDTRLDSEYPYQVFDSLIVARNTTLAIAEGVRLHFHDKSYMRVYGSLVTEGTPGSPVDFCGDRMGNVVGKIPFDLMASQWLGLEFAEGSRGNKLSHTLVRNTTNGVIAGEDSEIQFLNCRLHNSAGYVLTAENAEMRLIGCELSDAADGVMNLSGGTAEINHCTFANYYLFAAVRGALVQLNHYNSSTSVSTVEPYLKADFSNCILYGTGSELSMKDLSGSDVKFRRCLFRSHGTDDDNFIDCLWGIDPLYGTVREEYIFDYRLRSGSPAIGMADPALTLPEAAVDFYNIPRSPNPSLGAYQMTAD